MPLTVQTIIMTDESAIIDKLFRRMLEVKTDGPKRAVFLEKKGKPSELAVECAKQLGSLEAMHYAANVLQYKIQDLRESNPAAFRRMSSDLRDLDYAWHGIHGWQA